MNDKIKEFDVQAEGDGEPKRTPSPVVTGITLALQEDGRQHVVLIYQSESVQLMLDLGTHEDAVQHIPLGDQIRATAATARRREIGLVEASSLNDIPEAFRRRG